jgi:hypothetical protein
MLTFRTLTALAAVAIMTTGAFARDLEESPAPFSITPLHPHMTGVPLGSAVSVPGVAGAPAIAAGITAGAPVQAMPAVGAALASYGGYLYPSNSVLVSYGSDLIANTDGRVFMHPGFPGHLMYWNANDSRWCYQDNRSMTGWFFLPREIHIPPPQGGRL